MLPSPLRLSLEHVVCPTQAMMTARVRSRGPSLRGAQAAARMPQSTLELSLRCAASAHLPCMLCTTGKAWVRAWIGFRGTALTSCVMFLCYLPPLDVLLRALVSAVECR